MKLIDSRVVGVRSARLCLTLADGTSHVVDVAGPVTGTVETVEDEVDVTAIGSPGRQVVPGTTHVVVELRGPLVSRRKIVVDP